ncbi:HAD family hydrolase [bacterium]|nr:HAD family hydrolase [candidate division CSSED10-310 bacterium]
MIGLCIFDLDGTLLNTIGDLAAAANTVLRYRGFPEHTESEYKNMVGDGISELVARMLPEGFRDAEYVRECVEAMEREYQTCWAERTRPYCGIDTVLQTLQTAGIPMAVLSNKPDSFTHVMVDHFFPGIRFSAVWGARAGFPRKPDPLSALTIAGAAAVPSAACVFVGDSEVDIRTARSAGMISVGVTWGFRSRSRLQKETPAFIIDSPDELPVICGILARETE